MKLNLTQLYLDLIAKFGQITLEVDSLKPMNENAELVDVFINLHVLNLEGVDLEDVKIILSKNIAGEVKQQVVRIKLSKYIRIYVEF